MPTCLMLIRYEERKEKIREQALLINIMAIGIKLGVKIDELKKAREMLDIIDEARGKRKKQKQAN
jgi:hypothetical protein